MDKIGRKNQQKEDEVEVLLYCSAGVAERRVIRIAQDLRIRMFSMWNRRKRSKPLITLLSGPHVHKKSRDQYKIENRCVIFLFRFTKGGARSELLELRRELSRLPGLCHYHIFTSIREQIRLPNTPHKDEQGNTNV